MSDTKKTFNKICLARIVLEAATPIAVGSGKKDIMTDSQVIKDVNGLPYIPGTSLAGVIRHMIGQQDADTLFGYQNRDDGMGSRIIFTHAKMIGHDGKVVEGLMNEGSKNDPFYQRFSALPIRQHVRINEKGTAANRGKFDEEVVYKGTRFCFEIEIIQEENSGDEISRILETIRKQTFRLGGGTRSGFGELQIISLKTVNLDLKTASDLDRYLSKSSSLNDDAFWANCKNENNNDPESGWITYQLKLNPDDFFLFSSGLGSETADITPVTESIIVWGDDSRPKFVDENILIPAASVKGAIAHRVAFYYNKLSQVFADEINIDEFENHVGKNNTAVRALFGSEGERIGNEMKNQQRGNVIFSDLISGKLQQKLLNHVCIDRFTGGAMEGMLFSEEVVYAHDQQFEMTILVNESNLLAEEKEKIMESFERSLNDIVSGMLPLGGGVNRGHGSFNGSFEPKNYLKD